MSYRVADHLRVTGRRRINCACGWHCFAQDNAIPKAIREHFDYMARVDWSTKAAQPVHHLRQQWHRHQNDTPTVTVQPEKYSWLCTVCGVRSESYAAGGPDDAARLALEAHPCDHSAAPLEPAVASLVRLIDEGRVIDQ